MLNVAKNNRKNVQIESDHAVKAVKMEIETIKIKGQFEETFVRFPHLGEKILENLDDQCLFECQKVSKPWQDFITENKILPIELLQKYTLLSKARLKKSVRKYDNKTVQKLVICAIDGCNQFTYTNCNSRVRLVKLLYTYLFYKKPLKTIPSLLVEVLIQNTMHPNITKLEDKRFNEFLQEVAFCIKNNFFWSPDIWGHGDEKEVVFSWSRILFVAVYCGHFSICKFVTEKVNDIHKASARAEILIATANKNGYHDISRLLENSFRIKK